MSFTHSKPPPEALAALSGLGGGACNAVEWRCSLSSRSPPSAVIQPYTTGARPLSGASPAERWEACHLACCRPVRLGEPTALPASLPPRCRRAASRLPFPRPNSHPLFTSDLDHAQGLLTLTASPVICAASSSRDLKMLLAVLASEARTLDRSFRNLVRVDCSQC